MIRQMISYFHEFETDDEICVFNTDRLFIEVTYYQLPDEPSREVSDLSIIRTDMPEKIDIAESLQDLAPKVYREILEDAFQKINEV